MAAQYEIITLSDGTVFAKTLVRWSRSFGKCNRQDFHRCGEIFTQSSFRAWCKKHGVTPKNEDIEKIPKKVWWE